MSHFAKIDSNNIVTNVSVIEQDVIDTGFFGDPASWIQTSYNTIAGVHTRGGTPLRKNYASIGYSYDPIRDAFIPPKFYPSWVLDEEKCIWKAPVAVPVAEEGVMYTWDEPTLSWVEDLPE